MLQQTRGLGRLVKKGGLYRHLGRFAKHFVAKILKIAPPIWDYEIIRQGSGWPGSPAMPPPPRIMAGSHFLLFLTGPPSLLPSNRYPLNSLHIHPERGRQTS